MIRWQAPAGHYLWPEPSGGGEVSLDSVLPARHGQVCPCGAPAVYGLLWRQPPGSRPALRHSLACDRCVPPGAARWAAPAVALDPLPPSAGPTRPPPVDLPSSSGEGKAAERSAAPVEAQAEPPAVAVAESEEVGRDLPAQEPLATAEGQPTSTPTPETQEAPMPGPAATLLPPVDPAAPEGRCRLQGCTRPSRCRGLCRYCHNRVLRAGRVEELGAPRKGAGGRRPRSIAPEPPAPESAPSTRSTPTRLAQEAHRKEPATEIPAPRSEGTEICEIGLQERDRYAAAEARIASLAAEATQLRARIEELEGLLARKIQQETMRADVAEKRFESLRLDILQSLPPTTLAFDGDNFCVLIRAAIDAERRRVESLRCALEQIAGYAPSPHLPDEVLIRESSEGVAWLRQELEAARGQIAALENSGREGDAAAEELARALGTFALPLLEVARRASAQILEAASRIADLRAALAEIVDQDLDGQTDADLIAAATSEIQRLRELLQGHKDELRTIYEAIEATPEIRLQDSPVGAADFVRWLSREHQRAVKSVSASTLETPESLERRYQALHTARRLRDLLEGREGLRVQLPEGMFSLQEIWLWDLLEPMLPGEIERLEREAGVSRG